jgi:Calcineurin-like phosphoesterase
MPDEKTAVARRQRTKSLMALNHSPTVGRMAITNHLYKAIDKAKYPGLGQFLSKNLWAWIWSYLKNFGPRYRFPTYQGTTTKGVYDLSSVVPLKLAIAGDWGTGTQEAVDVAALMCNPADQPDLTVHLGDIYYVGDIDEIEENCLGQSTPEYTGVTWPHGTRGSFALNGNHEMYANGKPYFTRFLTTLGMTGDAEKQAASFFCLETAQWRIIALDTGYNSVGMPILSMIPIINSISFIGADCHLESGLISWLQDTVKPKQNPKPTLLLSHHQYFTAFNDNAYTKPAKQLMEFFDGQEVVWLWGHEHRLGIYDRFQMDGGLTCFGRCIGHGGMPVDLGTPDRSKAPWIAYDARSHQLDGDPNTKVGENGFVKATINGNVLKLEYFDWKTASALLTEEFTPAADRSKLVRSVVHASDQLTYYSPPGNG